MAAVRKHATYANVMATIAVFVSLGGGAVAALRVPASAVGTKQLRKNAVTTGKVRNESLTGIDIKDGSLTGTDLKFGTLTGSNIAPASLPGTVIQPGTISTEQLPLLGLSGLRGASGTATSDPQISLLPATCERFMFTAPGVQPGDALMLQGSDLQALEHAYVGSPTIPKSNKMIVSICTDANTSIDLPPGAVQLRFDTLR